MLLLGSWSRNTSGRSDKKIDALAIQGKFNEALLAENENSQDLIDLYGKEDLRTIHSIGNMSSFSFSCGVNESDEELLNLVIDLRTKVQGEKHADTLASMASKGGILHVTVELRRRNDWG